MGAYSVVGVGRVGTALVERLVERGHHVSAFDVLPARRHAVEQAGAHWVDDVTSALGAGEVVFTVLPGSPELRAFTNSALPRTLRPGAVWIDMTSASPEASRASAELAVAHGLRYLDAPVAGGAEAVRAGSATLYVGGDQATLLRARPALEAFAGAVHPVGSHGAGHLVKLLINLLWFGQVGLVTEGLLLAQRHGLSPEHVASLLEGSAADSAFLVRHLPALLRGDYLADFGLDRCVEELAAVEDAAAAAEIPHPVTSAVADLHRAALEAYGPIDGELLAAAWLESRAGRALAEG